MSNLYHKLYIDSIKRLCRTIVIKDESELININKHINRLAITAAQKVDAERPETWKYYLNLNGEYHYTDLIDGHPIRIVSLDTAEIIDFTKENMLIHRTTRRDYRYGTPYYNELVEQYPDHQMLIRCIINPIDMKTAIESPDNTILYYDVSEVESNEDNLIYKLQEWIYMVYTKWFNSNYTINHELYAAVMRAGVLALLPKAVATIRKENRKTYKAHSYHVWSYLDSKAQLMPYKNYLLKSQSLWLYRNINYVQAKTGKQNTFNELMEVILTWRGIPIGHHYLEVDTFKIDETIYGTPYSIRYPLNLLRQLPPDPTERTIEYVMEKELPLAPDNYKFFEEDLTMLEDKVPKGQVLKLPTKVFESEMLDLSEQEEFTLADVLVYHWLYLSTNGRYTSNILVPNSVTGEAMSMSVREAFSLWIYLMGRINKLDMVVIPTINAYMVRRLSLPTYPQLKSVVNPEFVPDSYINTILDSQTLIGNLVSTDAFYETVYEIYQNLRYMNFISASFENIDSKGQFDVAWRKCYQDIGCELTTIEGYTYAEFFSLKGWEYIETMPIFEMEALAIDVMNYAVGTNVRSVVSLKDIQKAMLEIMDKLGAYTSQYIATINNDPLVNMNFQYLRGGDIRGYDEDAIVLNTGDLEFIKAVDYDIDKMQLDLYGNNEWGANYPTEICSCSFDVILDMDITMAQIDYTSFTMSKFNLSTED